MTDPEIIALVQQTVTDAVAGLFQTVRIPELPSAASQGTLNLLTDKVPYYLGGVDKTVWASMQELRTLLTTGSNVVLQNVLTNGEFVYITQNADIGQTSVVMPAFAGLDFYLRLEGRPLIKRDPANPLSTDEYAVISGGGFQLLNGLQIDRAGQRFTLEFYTLKQQAAGGSPNPATNAPLFKDRLPISTNKTLTAADLNKIWQLRGSSSQITATFPLLGDIPDNTIIMVEALIGNSKENKITTQGGAFFYLNNTSFSSLYVRPGEVVMLVKLADGFYVWSEAFSKTYNEIGRPVASFSVGLNEWQLNGQQVKKGENKRLNDRVQSFPNYCDKATFDSDPVAYRAYYVDYDTTYLQLPNLTDLYIRGVDGTTRAPGTYQADAVGPVTVTGNVPARASGTSGNGAIADGNNDGQGTTVAITLTGGGTETITKNAGALWITKA